uniref:Uncharacterized protein n=1 Tax=Arundo donax TaxID=35708 RepID=A0A0A8Y7D8_ARUDO
MLTSSQFPTAIIHSLPPLSLPSRTPESEHSVSPKGSLSSLSSSSSSDSSLG